MMSSLSHDDIDQWTLIHHWFEHYQGRLNLQPERFLLILHSDNRNITGLSRMARWLRREYGVLHTVSTIEPYTAYNHMLVKHELLRRFVTPSDWVMQVDADEFVFFPSGGTAAEVLDQVEQAGHNVHYALMVDRVAADGDVDLAPTRGSSIFKSFPLNCALTLLIQQSDVRKACAYRGYLRATTGNHNVLGLNASAAVLSRKHPVRTTRRYRRAIGEAFGHHDYNLLPESYHKEGQPLPSILHVGEFATAYHFKWIRGLAQKLRRRATTEVSTSGQYAELRNYLDMGTPGYRGLLVPPSTNSFGSDALKRLCNLHDLPGPEVPIRALTSLELMMLFQNAKPEHLENILEQGNVPQHQREAYISRLLERTMNENIARESNVPTH